MCCRQQRVGQLRFNDNGIRDTIRATHATSIHEYRVVAASCTCTYRNRAGDTLTVDVRKREFLSCNRILHTIHDCAVRIAVAPSVVVLSSRSRRVVHSVVTTGPLQGLQYRVSLHHSVEDGLRPTPTVH